MVIGGLGGVENSFSLIDYFSGDVPKFWKATMKNGKNNFLRSMPDTGSKDF
jgi:hypothetical protein